MEHDPIVTINLVVLNGERYIRHCLQSIKKQTFDHRRVIINILDNGSTDQTIPIIEDVMLELTDFNHVNFIKNTHNLGMWSGHEQLLNESPSVYIVVLSVDVILAENFLDRAIPIMESKDQIGALQGKIYQYQFADLGNELPRSIIDTCGFKIFRSRRIINIGHGDKDQGQYNIPKEIFGVEGAVPIFRKKALESIRVLGEITDHDLFWYAEDLDVAWRIRMAGWIEWYDPTVIAWHDRQTTKTLRRGWWDVLSRIKIRHQIPIQKRRLGWRNIHFTIIKNDYIINILKDLPYIIAREIGIFVFTLLFEPQVFTEMINFFRLLPRMLHKRNFIISHAKTSPVAIHHFFN